MEIKKHKRRVSETLDAAIKLATNGECHFKYVRHGRKDNRWALKKVACAECSKDSKFYTITLDDGTHCWKWWENARAGYHDLIGDYTGNRNEVMKKSRAMVASVDEDAGEMIGIKGRYINQITQILTDTFAPLSLNDLVDRINKEVAGKSSDDRGFRKTFVRTAIAYMKKHGMVISFPRNEVDHSGSKFEEHGTRSIGDDLGIEVFALKEE